MELISRRYYNLTSGHNYKLSRISRLDHKLHGAFNKSYKIRIYVLDCKDEVMSPDDYKYTGFQEPFNNIPKRIKK